MLVMLLGGGAVASTVGTATPNVGLPPVPPSPLRLGDAPAAGPPRPGVAPAADVALAEASAAASSRTSQTWVVQVGAFASRERAMLSIARLTAAGWPAYLDEPDAGARGNLTMVLVGPYGAAAVADVARDRLRTTPGYEGAFVRGVTPGK